MSNDKSIQKSRSNIHYELSPGTKMTATAAKTLYVFTYFIQSMAKKFPSIAAFNADFGTGSTEVTIPKYQLFKYTVGASTDQKTGSRNYKILRDVIDELKELSISWDNKAEEGKENRGFIRVFPSIVELNGDITFTVPSKVRQFFVDDNYVASIDWMKVNESISSRYAIFLNEIIEERMFGLSETAASLNFTDDEIRTALKVTYTVDDSGRKTYINPTLGSLKAKVLTPAITQYNDARLTFEVLNCEYRASEGYWFIDITRRIPQLITRANTLFPDEMIRINTFFSSIRLSTSAKEKYTLTLTNEKEIRYILYLIDIFEENKKRVTTSLAGYFNGCYQSNRDHFELSWEDIQNKQRLEKEKNKQLAKEAIAKQNSQFREDFIKMQHEKFRISVLDDKVQDFSYLDAYKTFLTKSLMIPSFKQELEVLSRNGNVNADSMPFRSFVTEYVKIDESECRLYVSRQTKTLKV